LPNAPKTPGRNIRVPDTTWGALRSQARALGLTVSQHVRNILTAHLTKEN